MRWPLAVGALLAMTAVMAGALGAHGLRSVLAERGLEVFDTAATYQFYHGLALVLVALLSGFDLSRRLLVAAASLFVIGTVLFSGSLYVLVLTDIRWVGPITPIGGLCFLAGWLMLVVAACRRSR